MKKTLLIFSLLLTSLCHANGDEPKAITMVQKNRNCIKQTITNQEHPNGLLLISAAATASSANTAQCALSRGDYYGFASFCIGTVCFASCTYCIHKMSKKNRKLSDKEKKDD